MRSVSESKENDSFQNEIAAYLPFDERKREEKQALEINQTCIIAKILLKNNLVEKL